MMYTDIIKGFDRVNHDLLLDKLHQFGVSDVMIELFTSNSKGYILRVLRKAYA